ncbi:MAG: tyrosine-type recombinase/integrase [Acidimicrobiales bacterium]|nr:tyrosine-type recombinase/integrase [Acidimicrobiales bacterium]
MRGHIQQRGKTSWRVKVFIGRDASGVRRYVERTVRGTRREAERELSRLLVEVDEGRHAAAAPITFGELLDRWLDVKRRLVEPKTIESYEWVARKYVRPALGERKVASLRPIDLDELYSELHGRGLSARTVRICHTVIRQALEQARRWGLIARNPAVDATPPTQRRREIVPPTVEQVQTLLEAAEAEDQDFAAYLWVLAATGCRRGEACALRWTDVDLERAEVAIRRSISQVKGELREKDTKTHQSRRVAIDEQTVAVLRAVRLRARGRFLALGERLADDAVLFSDAEGRPWRPDVCTNRFARLRAGVGLEKVRLHDLRHFVATVLGGAGVPIATISGRLGHSENATTLNLYTHVMPATDQAAAVYLGSILSEIRRTTGTSGPPR